MGRNCEFLPRKEKGALQVLYSTNLKNRAQISGAKKRFSVTSYDLASNTKDEPLSKPILQLVRLSDPAI